jgi:Ca2+-binding EF-hand superfamily protein
MSGLLADPRGQVPLLLPKIAHPSTRIDDPNSLNITARSVSRASSLGTLADKYLKEKNANLISFQSNQKQLESDNFLISKSNTKKTDNLLQIPENANVVYSGDLNRVSMPIFGSRPITDQNQRSASALSTSQRQQIEIEEYFEFLKEKMKHSFHEVKTKFKNADPNGRGGVSKEAFAHIVASILGPSKQLNHQNYLKLLERLGFNNNTLIKYDDFKYCFNNIENKTSNGAASGDFQNNNINGEFKSNSLLQQPVTRKATQVFVILKEKAKLKTSDMCLFVPQLLGGESSKIFKIDLLNNIKKMSIKMEEEEFEKLWKKIDSVGSGFVKSDDFLKRLGALGGDQNNLEENFFDENNFDDSESPKATSRPVSIPFANLDSSNFRNKNK